MEIWLDTCCLKTIKKAYDLGILHGVTTNPNIVLQSPFKVKDLFLSLLNAQGGPVTAQVVSQDEKVMIQQGKLLHKISPRIIIKVPLTTPGLMTISQLSQQGIPIMATCVFTPLQAFLATRAGAHYVACYYSRIEKSGNNPKKELQSMLDIYKTHRFSTKIMAASIHSLEQIQSCIFLGIQAVTLPKITFENLIAENPQTLDSVDAFYKDWESCKEQVACKI